MSESGTETGTASRPSLDGIPFENIQMIVDQLDKTSSIRLAQVCHSPIINYPGIAKDHRLDRALDWLAIEGPVAAAAAKTACLIGLHQKLKDLIKSGTEERWEMVARIKMCCRKGSDDLILLILRKAAATLIKLEIVGIPHNLTRYPPTYPMVNFGSLVIHPASTFPVLTRLKLGNGTELTVSLVKLLFLGMPRIHTLDLDLRSVGATAPLTIRLPEDAQLPSLRRLNVKWDFSYDPYDEEEAEYDESINDLQILSVTEIIRRSPRLEQFGFVSHSVLSSFHCREVPRILARLANLRDIYSSGQKLFTNNNPQYHLPDIASTSTKRIVLRVESWINMFDDHLYNLNVEIIHLIADTASLRRVPSLSAKAKCPSAHFMFFELKRMLSRCPLLRIIHFLRENIDDSTLNFFTRLDQIEQSGLVSGKISSITHGGQELLIARFLHDFVDEDEVDHEDDAWDLNFAKPGTVRPDFGKPKWVTTSGGHSIWLEPPKDYVYRQRTTMQDTDRNGVKFTRKFKQTAVFTWQVYTDYNDYTIPLEVIQQMKDSESEIEDWERRGVEVGEAAWKILLEYVDAQA